ncbi:orexin receptor type 2 [Plakobranchus ocellatus]|uniref:Orexin receptor type 2 n=1 Tax=Plakobranchus ocellatus TaxID=259542 RepID=A0AAV3Z893_9GAST|nr:orexin receptor type 2 [Plakobranchus ocellatus]
MPNNRTEYDHGAGGNGTFAAAGSVVSKSPFEDSVTPNNTMHLASPLISMAKNESSFPVNDTGANAQARSVVDNGEQETFNLMQDVVKDLLDGNSTSSAMAAKTTIYEYNEEDASNYTDYEFDYVYDHSDIANDAFVPGDTDFIIRSDGTIQKISSIDFSKAIIFNITEPGDFNASFNASDSFWLDPSEETGISTSRTVAAIVFSIMFLLGLLGNVLVVYTVWRYAGMRRVTYFFLVNLAVTNLMYLLLGLPTITVSYLTVDWPFGDPFCKLDNYVMSVSMAVSILTIMATGFDRYLAVVYPVRSRRIRTKTLSLLVISAIWLVSLVSMIPRALLYTTQPFLHDSRVPTTLCVRLASTQNLRIDTGLRFGLLYILPLAVLIICHLRIGKALWTRATPRSTLHPAPHRLQVQARRCQVQGREIEEEESRDETRNGQQKRSCLEHTAVCGLLYKNGGFCRNTEEAEQGVRSSKALFDSQTSRVAFTSTPTVAAIKERRRMAKIVLALTAVFALGWLPIHLHYLAQDFRLISPTFLAHVLDRGTVPLLFCFGANALNPFLYCVFSSNFRRHFRMAFGHCCCCVFRLRKDKSRNLPVTSRNNEGLERLTRKPTTSGASRRSLLHVSKQVWTEYAESGENSETEELCVRRSLPPLQPRPASLLLEEADTRQAVYHRAFGLPHQHIPTLPGQCDQTSEETSGLGKFHHPLHGPFYRCENEITKVEHTPHNTEQSSENPFPAQLVTSSSSTMELQRQHDVSPVSVGKIAHILITPGEKSALVEGEENIDADIILSSHSCGHAGADIILSSHSCGHADADIILSSHSGGHADADIILSSHSCGHADADIILSSHSGGHADADIILSSYSDGHAVKREVVQRTPTRKCQQAWVWPSHGQDQTAGDVYSSTQENSVTSQANPEPKFERDSFPLNNPLYSAESLSQELFVMPTMEPTMTNLNETIGGKALSQTRDEFFSTSHDLN